MSDYIDRQMILHNAADNQHEHIDDRSENEYGFWTRLYHYIEAAPAADVRSVVRGKWEFISFLTVKCSNCQEIFHQLEEYNFCPNCGADMRK